jgi:transcription antitermination factor NusG
MEGYVFVKDCPEVRENLNNLQETRIFSGALFLSGKYQTVSSDVIGSLKKKLKNSLKRKFVIGTKVIVLGGVFKNLKGEVISIEENGKKIMIKIKRLTREIIAPIPSTLLERMKDN